MHENEEDTVFQGSIPSHMRSIVRETVLSWGVPELYVGCSGNFTIQRTLPELRNHGNDVTLYSSALGNWATNQLMDLRLTEEAQEHLPWIADYVRTPEDVLATIMLGTRFFNSVGRDNHYHARVVEGYTRQWDRLMEGTREKLRASGFTLESYGMKDVREWVRDDVPADGAFASFPPFWAGGYEDLDKPLEKVFEWDEPEYEIMGEPEKDELVELVRDREHWLLGLHEPRESLEEHLTSLMRTNSGAMPIYIYASKGPTRAVGKHVKLERFNDPVITADTELTGKEKVSFWKMTYGQFARVRSKYLNAGIWQGTPSFALAVKLDDVVVGFLAFRPPEFKKWQAYMLTDFPVGASSYERLSALMPALAASEEVRTLLNRAFNGSWITEINTTAFSDNPVSMKYRNAKWKLHKRDEATEMGKKYRLSYDAEYTGVTAQEAYEAWFKKNSKYRRRRPGAVEGRTADETTTTTAPASEDASAEPAAVQNNSTTKNTDR